MDSVDYVTCEVCGLPHRLGVATCEECEHLLGSAPDWHAIRGKRASLARQSVAALALIVGMLWLNYLFFEGAGYIILTAPVFWLVLSAYRYRLLSKFLARSARLVEPDR